MEKSTFELRNHILFDSVQKIEIPATIDKINLVEAVTANKELSNYGFTLDVKGIMNLAHNTPQDIADIKDSICKVIEASTGIIDFRNSEPFYPDFPEEVMEKSDFELAVNAMLYYAFSQTDDPEMTKIALEIRDIVSSDKEDRIEREPIPVEQDDLKIASAAEPDTLEELLYDRTQALSMSSGHFEDIQKYADAYPDTWCSRIFGEGENKDVSMPSHETRANVATIAYRHGDLDTAQEMMPNAEDVLRFAAVLSAGRNEKAQRVGMDANLSVEPQKAVFSFSRPDKTAVKTCLEATGDLFVSMWHRPDMWEKLMNRLDTKDSRFPRMEAAFDNLRNNNRVDERGVEIPASAGSDLERLIRIVKDNPANSGASIESFAEMHPKVFIRNIERIGRELPPNSDSVRGLCRGILNNSGDIPVAQLMKLENHVEKADGWDIRIFTNSKGKIHAEENTVGKIDVRVKADIMNSLDKVIDINLTRDPVGKVYIAPELSGVALPLRNVRDASDGAVLTKYSVLEGNADKNIVAFGIFWKNQGNERGDIDLSVIGFKEGYKGRTEVYWDNPREAWAVHSGDYVSGVIAPEINGAVEYVFVDKQKCEELGIRYIMPQVHGFNIPFSKADSVRFCFMEKNRSLDNVETRTRDEIERNPRAPMFEGELINPTEVNTSYRLTQDSRTTIPLLYDIKEDKYIWIDQDISVGMIPTAVDEVVKNKSALVLYEAKHNDYPSLGEIAERYTISNGGEVTNDIKEADLIFSFGNVDKEGLGLKSDAEVISSLDLDKISAEFCNATEISEPDEQAPNDVDAEEFESEYYDAWLDEDDDWDPVE